MAWTSGTSAGMFDCVAMPAVTRTAEDCSHASAPTDVLVVPSVLVGVDSVDGAAWVDDGAGSLSVVVVAVVDVAASSPPQPLATATIAAASDTRSRDLILIRRSPRALGSRARRQPYETDEPRLSHERIELPCRIVTRLGNDGSDVGVQPSEIRQDARRPPTHNIRSVIRSTPMRARRIAVLTECPIVAGHGGLHH